MYYDLAMAGENEELAMTTNKIAKFGSIAPCGWVDSLNRNTQTTEFVQGYFDMLNEFPEHFISGESSNVEADLEYHCYTSW